MMSFDQVYVGAHPDPDLRFQGRIGCFDPGETTGFALFEATGTLVHLRHARQLKTWGIEDAVRSFTSTLDELKPDVIVYESYRVYGWKTDEHSFSDIPTLQVIGCLKTLCVQRKIAYHDQSAQQAKQFVTDEKLERWGFYREGLRHSRDAMRHGCYFLTFGPKK
jgi:hypothetical protein